MSADALLSELMVVDPSTAAYSQSFFGDGWDDSDGDGCDTRAEVLQTESAAPVTYSSGCAVATGEWTSPYDGAVLTDASDVDIDDLVPLGEAWASGAARWTFAQRVAYANDLDYPGSLIAVSTTVNDSKGGQDISQWLPPLDSDRCQYAVDWVAVKWRWNETVDATEKVALDELLPADGCGQTVVEIAKSGTPVLTSPDTLATQETLTDGQSLVSPNGAFTFTMQTDGNAVVYQGSTAIFNTHTANNPGAYLSIRSDGNLTVYSSSGTPLWFDSARGSTASLKMQDDGNLVEYGIYGALWSSKKGLVRPVTDTLRTGAVLTGDQSLVSSNGVFTFTMQTDGNAVVYQSSSQGITAIFNTHTANNPGAHLSMQTDGNLVLYSSSGRALWYDSARGSGAYLKMQDDGNLVEYAPTGALWSSKKGLVKPPTPSATDTLHTGAVLTGGLRLVSANRVYTFTVQTDGNAVVYQGATAIFNTHTAHNPGARLSMQTDGNLVLYSSSGRALWYDSARGSGAYLKMQDDGNLVEYAPTGALWSSKKGLVRPPTPPTPPPVQTGITPGAYCSPPGARGRSDAGNTYICSFYSSDGRYHWKRA